mgnify:CR=1 FL=1
MIKSTLWGLPEAEQRRSFVDLAQRMYFRGRAASIYGGSHEVQKNIVAKQVSGLLKVMLNPSVVEGHCA